MSNFIPLAYLHREKNLMCSKNLVKIWLNGNDYIAQNPTHLSACGSEIELRCIFQAYWWQNEQENDFFITTLLLNWSLVYQFAVKHWLNIVSLLRICVILHICDGKTRS